MLADRGFQFLLLAIFYRTSLFVLYSQQRKPQPFLLSQTAEWCFIALLLVQITMRLAPFRIHTVSDTMCIRLPLNTSLPQGGNAARATNSTGTLGNVPTPKGYPVHVRHNDDGGKPHILEPGSECEPNLTASRVMGPCRRLKLSSLTPTPMPQPASTGS